MSIYSEEKYLAHHRLQWQFSCDLFKAEVHNLGIGNPLMVTINLNGSELGTGNETSLSHDFVCFFKPFP